MRGTGWKNWKRFKNGETLVIEERTKDLIKNIKQMKTAKGIGQDIQAYLQLIMSVAFLFQKDQTPFRENLQTAIVLIDSLEAENKHWVFGELSDFLIDLISRERLEIIKGFIGELKNISQDTAAIFRPLNYVVRYFEIIYSDEKSAKERESKAQRLLDSITSEIKDPVKEMIGRVKENSA
ncbi:conserved hypothetical protein [delta proteobacterium NaphS2]|nr:conserved hypothetical protein [delta proteobacterium NaphS2]